jgi:hypothetical protein
MGEADLFEPWNDNDSAERIDASAFQDLANPELYTRRLSLIRNLQSNRPEFSIAGASSVALWAATSCPSP